MGRLTYSTVLLAIIIFYFQLNILANNGIDWVKIKKGPFLYTAINDTLSLDYDFFISKTEITNGQYLKYLNEIYSHKQIKILGNRVIGYYDGDSYWKNGFYTFFYFKNNDSTDIFRFNEIKFTLRNDTLWQNHPLTNITWFGANAFAKHYGYSLPTDLEWEKSARGLNDFNYPWGDSLTSQFANYFNSGDDFDNGTTPVMYFTDKYIGRKDNSSYYGVYDLIGNVSEWTNSFSKIYLNYRVFRGGSWRNNKIDFRVYLVGEGGPELATDYIGFRCVKHK